MPLASENCFTLGSWNGRGSPALGWVARNASSGNDRFCGFAVWVGVVGCGTAGGSCCVVTAGVTGVEGWVEGAADGNGAGCVLGAEPQAATAANDEMSEMESRRFTTWLQCQRVAQQRLRVG